MTANVTFVYAERKGVLRIPSAALRFLPPPELLAEAGLGAAGGEEDAQEGQAAATTAGRRARRGRPAAQRTTGAGWRRGAASARSGCCATERLVAVPVEVGVADGSQVEVRGGELAEGDVVVTDAIDKNERAEAKAKGKGGLF